MILKKQLTVKSRTSQQYDSVRDNFNLTYLLQRIDWIDRFFVFTAFLVSLVTDPKVAHARSCLIRILIF